MSLEDNRSENDAARSRDLANIVSMGPGQAEDFFERAARLAQVDSTVAAVIRARKPQPNPKQP